MSIGVVFRNSGFWFAEIVLRSFSGFAVSETNSLVESQLCDIVFSNELFGVVRLYSTALFVSSGFSDKRFETAHDLSAPKHVKLVLAKRQLTSNQSFRFGN
ncbi:hypothetical protein [Vibrio alginolyticus]|uniref:hypothetical protein n=1 Tax=Vibrio alginolyticus TaxID=663 RepID=UPI002022CC51|nr:hypothetical protein [Vibrio alginolyticus]